MKKNIAIIGSGYTAVVYSKKAKEMGLITHAFSNNPYDKVKGHSDFHHNISIFDVYKIVEICKKHKIQGVLPTTELTISIASQVSNKLNTKGLDVELSKQITNKAYVRNETMSLKNIKHPKYLVYKIDEPIPKINFFPVIVKPTSLGGKRGISTANSSEELIEAINYAVEYTKSKKDLIIIEEFISSGQEYSVETLSFNNEHSVIQITEKLTSKPPHVVELGHFQPANINNSIRKRIITGIVELLDLLKVNNTATHTEIKVVDNDIYLIELNTRLGGDHISDPLIELSTGYDYIKGIIKISLNEFTKPNVNSFIKNYSGIIFVTKQSQEFYNLFKKANQYPWVYKKNEKTKELQTLVNNQGFDINYFIYKSEEGLPKEIKKILEKHYYKS